MPATAAATKAAPKSTEYPNLPTALAAFQADLPSVRKNQTAKVDTRSGPGYSYDYADLTDISEVALPALAAVGLSWHTAPDTIDKEVVIRWELAHGASGETRTGTLPVGRAGQDWQSMGSAITYARRYALTAATGIAPGGDDDDAKSATSAGARPQPTAATQKPVERPVAVEYLPAGIYDLAGIGTKADAEKMYYTARQAGHLNLALKVGEADVLFGTWLRETGRALGEAEEAGDPDAVAVAEHEAAMALAGDDTPF